MADWPSSLPQYPQKGGFSKAPASQVISTSMSIGPAKRRKRYTKNYNVYSMTFEMTLDQFEDFEYFFKNDLGYGVVNFNIPDPFHITTTLDVRIVASQGSNPYTVTQWGDLYDSVLVTLNLRELA
jgi:hypothetical protein